MVRDSRGERGPEGITESVESVAARIEGLTEMILVPTLANTADRSSVNGHTAWRISKGSVEWDGDKVQLADRLPTNGDKDDPEYVLSVPKMIINGNIRSVLWELPNGMPMSPSNAEPIEDGRQARQVESLLEEILADSERIATQEQQIAEQKRDLRHHDRAIKRAKFGKWAVRVAIAVGLVLQSPNIVDEADQLIDNYHEHQADERARKAADEAAERAERNRRTTAFDSQHPKFDDSSIELRDNIPVVVPFTEQFDGTSVPGQAERRLPSRHIRALVLPDSGDCETFELDIPEGARLQAARTGDPENYVFARQDGVGNQLEVCNKRIGEDEEDDKIEGEFFLQMTAVQS